jgi:inositol phosphorylceramide mannosyltransferase catalytic subunit
MRIPRIFHRIWLGNRPMPAEFVAYGRSFEKLHPNWRFVLWTDDNLPAMKNRWIFDKSSSWAAKANVLRYEVLFEHGGVYIDTDFECKRNLEPLLADVECFVARQGDGVINNAIIGAVPGHPFLRKVIGSLGVHARFVFDEVPSVTQSGPYFFTKIADRFEGITVFPPELFYPYQWHERWRRNEEFEDSYAVHHWTLSARSTEFPAQRSFGNGTWPSLALLIVPEPGDDGSRLEWVLEGIRVQSITDVEVFVVDVSGVGFAKPVVANMAHSGFSVRAIDKDRWSLRPIRLADLCNMVLKEMTAPRLLLLDGDCIPDTDVLETHAAYGSAGTAPFGFRRIYPAHKFYRFLEPVDYPGLRLNSLLDPRRSHPYPPFFGDWRDVEGYTLSAPKWAWELIGGFTESSGRLDYHDLAYSLSQKLIRLLPLWRPAWVTQLAAEAEDHNRARSFPALAQFHSEDRTFDERGVRPRRAPEITDAL